MFLILSYPIPSKINQVTIICHNCSLIVVIIRVFCHAGNLSLLCPSFKGIKKMLRTCEIYAEKHKILFNA